MRLRAQLRSAVPSAHTGQLLVSADSVAAVVSAFRALRQARFPLRQMRLVDYCGGDDETSMAADNTSAFERIPSSASSTGRGSSPLSYPGRCCKTLSHDHNSRQPGAS
ncbi:MAG TPA: hypothetical protein VNF71_02145 [Acidimicrobiales bacterium]|nr:hypothetical protein [Acidimicrobiales bacterium]